MGREARARQQVAPSTPEIAPFVFAVPISKRDDERRLVSGIATSEVLDRQGEVTDYETAKAFFTNPDLWPGNVREMHQPKAVGKTIEVECDDANKTISITARISKGAEDTWTKVCDGTLSMFSIGGSGRREVEKVGDQVIKRLYIEQLAEVSLVDNGANPEAKFEMVKAADGKLVDAQPADPVDDAAVVDAALAKAAAALDAVTKKDDVKDDDKHKTASGQDGKEYAGTDGKSFPIAEPKDVANAARALGRTDQDRTKVKANIIRIAYKLGDAYVAQLPEAWKKATDKKDADKALVPLTVRKAEDGVGDEGDQVQMLRAALAAALEFLQAEYEEQFEADGYAEPWDIDQALAAISQLEHLLANEMAEAAMAAAEPSDALVAMAAGLFTASLSVIHKAGARHSKSDVDMIQQVHDLAKSLGAMCQEDGEAAPDESAEKVIAFVNREAVTQVLKDAGWLAPATDTLKVTPVEDTEAFHKLSADLDAAKTALDESKATVAKQAETVADLAARLEAIERLPAAGGPVRNAHAVPVDKSLGGPSDPSSTQVSPESLIAALEAVAKDGDPAVKAAAATQIVKLRRQLGADRIAL